MPASEFDILSALRVLHNAPRDILQAHRDLALQTLEQVRAALTASSDDQTGNFAASSKWGAERPCPNAQPSSGYLLPLHFEDSTRPSTGEDSSCHSTASTEDDPGAADTNRNRSPESASVDHRQSDFSSPAPARVDSNQTHARKRKRGPAKQSQPEKLLQTVREHLPQLAEYSKERRSLLDMLQNGQGRECLDMRLEHIKRVDGNKTPNDQERLLKGLCQISLARQFTAWERERGWIPRVDQLRSQINASRHAETRKRNHRLGKISRYIRDTGYPKSDHSVANKAICQGTIQLVFKPLMEDALGDSVRPNAIEGIFAAVTVFESYLFQSLKINEVLPFIDLLRQSACHLGATDSDDGNRSIHHFEAITAWSEGLQSEFESIRRMRNQFTWGDISQEAQIMTARTQENMACVQSDGPSETSSITPADPAEQDTYNNIRVVSSRNTNGLSISEPNENSGTSENLNGQGATDVALSDLNQNQLYTVRELVSVDDDGADNSTQRTGNMIKDSAEALRLHRSLTVTQDSSAPFQTESGGMATMHPCAFPQFVPPAYIDTVVPSTSPQYFLPESMSVETMVPYPDFASTAVDIMVSSNFPQFTPFASTHSLVDPDYGNCQTNASCSFQTQQDMNNSSPFGGIVETPTAV